MQEKYTFNLQDIYTSDLEWEKDYKKLENDFSLAEFKGKLSMKESFLACSQKQEKVSRVLDKLYVYAMLKHDKDTTCSASDALMSRVMTLAVKISADSAFISPELSSLKTSTIKEYIKDKNLKDYDYFLKCLLKEKAHILSEKEEKLLAMGQDALSNYKEIFNKIDDADLPLKPFKYKGKIINMSHGGYGEAMHDSDRNFRKAYFKKYYDAYISLASTITATYYGNVKKGVFLAKVRGYNSVLEKALSSEDVDSKVYYNLLEQTNKNVKLLHKYMKIKKKESGYKNFHMYDVYASTISGGELKLDYDKAYDLVLEGLAPLGKEYVEILKTARDGRWIDVEETKGKRSGAYSVCVYDTHPYVLLNYKKTTHDIFTIAHEMGHSIHSMYSNKTQPYAKADYKIFVAEVASTVNEVLLHKHLLKLAKTKKEKKYLLSYLLEMIRTTLFRQTQFAEFEEFTHNAVFNGEPLTKDILCQKYLEINKKYYGKSVVCDKEISYEWSRIPHFYRAFYVYKYATGIISALAIAQRIMQEGEVAVKDYIKFLSSGGSDSPVELLKLAGVDLTKKTPFISAFKVFEEALNSYQDIDKE